MRRSLLMSVTTLGAAMAMASVTGVVAAFTDEVKLGTNRFETGALARAVDLQIAARDSSGACGTYGDDTVTAPYSLTNVQPNSAVQGAGPVYCLRNAGRVAATVSFRAFDVVDDEVGCSPDEAEAGDTTCGSGAGELSNLVRVEMMRFGTDCSTGGGSGSAFSGPTIAQLTTAAAPVAGVTLAPGQCINIRGTYLYNPSEVDASKAQTDRVTFSLALNGVSA